MTTEAEQEHWPERLDPKAQGYTRQCVAHINFGPGKGAATYRIHDAEGKLLPVTYSYSDGGKTRWWNLGELQCDTWAEVCRAYPLHRVRRMATK